MALATAHVDIVANTDRFEKDLQSKLKQTGASAGKAFQQSFQKSMGRIKPPAVAKKFGSQGTSAGQAFAKNFSKAAGNIKIGTSITKSVSKTVDRDGKSMGARFGSTFAKAAIAPIAGIGKGVSTALSSIMDIGGGGGSKAFGALAVAAGAATAAVAPLAGALAAIPAAVAGAGTAVSTLAVAFQGMGEAVSAGMSGDMEKFQEALDGLAPSAQNVAKEVVGLKPAFDKLKSSVQGKFFEPLEESISRLSGVITGPIQDGMNNLAGALGEAAKAVTDFFASEAGGAAMKAVFDGIAASVRQVTPAIKPLMQGLTDLAAAGADRLGGIAPMLERIGNAMSNFANSGGVDRWLTAAATAARQLWTAIQPLGSAIKAMAGPLGTVGAAVREVMAPAFRAVATAVKALAPVFQKLADLIGPVLGAVVPPIADAFAGLAKAIGAALGPALKAAAPIIRKIAQQLGPVLSKAVTKLVPQLIRLGKQIGEFLVEAFKKLAPVISFLLPIVIDTFKGIVKAIKSAIQFLTGIFKALTGLLQGDWGKMWAGIKQAALGAVKTLWNIFVAWILGKVMKVFKLFGGMLKGLWNRIWSAVSGTVGRWIGQIVAWVVRMKDRILGFFSNAGSWLIDAGRKIMQGLLSGLRSMWGKVTGFVGGIGDWIKRNKGPLSYDRRLLIPAGEAIMRGLQEGLERGWGDVASTISGITDALPKQFTAGGAGSAPFAQNPMPMSAVGTAGHSGLLPPAGARGGQRVTNNHHTTTIGAPTIHVSSASEDPERVARRTANRIAQLSTA